jgi:hypothetical protein
VTSWRRKVGQPDRFAGDVTLSPNKQRQEADVVTDPNRMPDHSTQVSAERREMLCSGSTPPEESAWDFGRLKWAKVIKFADIKPE